MLYQHHIFFIVFFIKLALTFWDFTSQSLYRTNLRVPGVAPIVPMLVGDCGNQSLIDSVVAKYYKERKTAQKQVGWGWCFGFCCWHGKKLAVLKVIFPKKAIIGRHLSLFRGALRELHRKIKSGGLLS